MPGGIDHESSVREAGLVNDQRAVDTVLKKYHTISFPTKRYFSLIKKPNPGLPGHVSHVHHLREGLQSPQETPNGVRAEEPGKFEF